MNKTEMQVYKGEKYIYLLMALKLCRLNKNKCSIGKDNGYTGGQNYYRKFSLSNYNDKWILTETKYSSASADFSRSFEILNIDSEKPSIMDYMNEDNENCGKCWTH